jgi:glycosyltransferase involved in cell wall biosynthesis
MSEKYPLITAFTLIYNTNPEFVIEAIQSIINNNYPNLQHIIIDDCSPDTTPKTVVKKWISDNNYNCEFHEHDKNLGICGTLNHVIELAKGEYIIGCSDDILMPNTIFKLLEAFNENKEIAVAYGKYKILHNGIIGSEEFPKLKIFEKTDNVININDLLKGNPITAITCMLRRKTIIEIGGYENWIFEDYPMWFKLIINNYRIIFINEILGYYRLHDNNFSSKFNGFEIANFIVLNYFKNNNLVKKELKKRILQARKYDKKKYFSFIKIYYKIDIFIFYKIYLKLKLIIK